MNNTAHLESFHNSPLLYPQMNRNLLQLWRTALKHEQDPIIAWNYIQNHDKLRNEYCMERGHKHYVRTTWDEALTVVAAAILCTVHHYGPQAVLGFAPNPALSMANHSAGARFLHLLDARCMSATIDSIPWKILSTAVDWRHDGDYEQDNYQEIQENFENHERLNQSPPHISLTWSHHTANYFYEKKDLPFDMKNGVESMKELYEKRYNNNSIDLTLSMQNTAHYTKFSDILLPTLQSHEANDISYHIYKGQGRIIKKRATSIPSYENKDSWTIFKELAQKISALHTQESNVFFDDLSYKYSLLGPNITLSHNVHHETKDFAREYEILKSQLGVGYHPRHDNAMPRMQNTIDACHVMLALH